MGVIAADTRALVECLPSRSRGARLLIVEGTVVVNEIADRLNPGPTRSCVSRTVATRLPTEGPSRNSGCPAGTPASPRADPQRRAAERREPLVRNSRISHNSAGGESNPSRWPDNPAAPVCEPIPIRSDGDLGFRRQIIGDDDIRRPRVVDMDRRNHRSGLRKGVDEFVTNLYLHHGFTLPGGMGCPIPRSTPESTGSQLFNGAEPIFVWWSRGTASALPEFIGKVRDLIMSE